MLTRIALAAGLLAVVCTVVPAAGAVKLIKNDDGRADGKKSLGGSGEMIRFTLPPEGGALTGVRIHGSRYGVPQAPDEDFLIFVMNEDLTKVLHVELAAYSLF